MQNTQNVQDTQNIQVKIIRSDRKTLAIQIKSDLTVVVRAPRFVSNAEIKRVLREREPWIQENLAKLKKQLAEQKTEEVNKLTEAEIQELADKAVKYIPGRVKYFAGLMGVSYGRITIRNQRTRWGSCTSKGNLNFNCLLMLAPEAEIDYVVVHELCHRKEMNHSKAFWDEVEKVLPDYRKSVSWLKKEGSLIMRRQP